MKLQHKFQPLEAEVSERGHVTGYASKFGIKDQGGDIVVKGAFSGGNRKVRMLRDHDPSKVAGVWDVIEEDSTGLHVEGRINLGTTLGKDLYADLDFGAVDGMSIGYRTVDAVKASGGRELRKVDLWEVSFVAFPMLPEAVVQSVKSIEGENPAVLKRFVEEIMREADFSADEAKAAAAAVARVRAEREVSDEHKAADFAAVLKDAIRGL
ncbi:HK97 family phage prohead protease [Salipiger sp. 1_MG-2023]|uniref:HK97 family phage prohead protease n=1 Tax=Salipiger sp. 1_MG-2023 TaxID=3062665 RepID=UPI0026E45DAE|nr:HK97 family phage prohead protease [Salipiger sp. 1_MG-2023]MDO6587337.1 HK97 family phage prohead protease [Salipiger sp. 1_MG-2023]